MTTTPAEGTVPAAAAPAAPAVVPAPASTVAAPAAAAPAVEPAPTPALDWRDKRIAQLSARLKEAQAQIPPAAAPAALPTQPSAVPSTGSAEFNAAVAAAASQQAEINAFNSMCNAVAADGRTRFGEKTFNDAAAALLRLVDMNDPQSLLNYNAFLTAANAAGDPAQILVDLGANLNEAARVLSLTPITMTAELTRKVAVKAASEPNGALPQAPRPLGTVVARAGNQHTQISPSDPARQANLAVPDWMARREQEVEARRRQKLGLPAQ